MKRTFKFLISFIVFIVIICLGKVYAASAGIKADSTSIMTGQSTTITVSVTSTEAWNLKISSTGGALSGTQADADAADGEVSKNVFTATFKADTPGSYTINLTGSITGSDLVKKNVTGSVTITVKAPVTPDPDPDPPPVVNQSSNANLSTLSVSPAGSRT